MTGLVSWSNGRCGDDGIAVVTEISGYVKWIDEVKDSVDHYFRQHLYGDVGYGPRLAYGVGSSYGSAAYGSNAFNSFDSLSPYYGNRNFGNRVSAYRKYSGYGNSARPYYRTSRHGNSYRTHRVNSSPYSGNRGLSYNVRASNHHNGPSYGRYSAPPGGFRPSY